VFPMKPSLVLKSLHLDTFMDETFAVEKPTPFFLTEKLVCRFRVPCIDEKISEAPISDF